MQRLSQQSNLFSDETKSKEVERPIQNRASKYHHLKDVDSIKKALINPKLLSLIPRLQLSQQVFNQCPVNIQNHITNLKQWNVMKDGQEHQKIRKSFTNQFMVYEQTKKNNYEFIKQATIQLIIESFNKTDQVDFHQEISIKLSVLLLAYILGIKNPDSKLKEKLFIWSKRMADTGMRYSLDENADYYQECHDFFINTLDEVEIALKNNVNTVNSHQITPYLLLSLKEDNSKYDLNGVLANMIKNNVIQGRQLQANQAQMWVLGGSHNPANTISIALGLILNYPEQLQKLKEIVKQDRAQLHFLLHQTTNEILRFFPSSHVIVRFANEDIEIPNEKEMIQIKKGEAVIMHLQDATRKLSNQFDIFRKGINHLAFGYGPHRCMGGETGQLCAEIVLESLLFSDIQINGKKLENLQLVKFDWENSGSFKEIHSLILKI